MKVITVLGNRPSQFLNDQMTVFMTVTGEKQAADFFYYRGKFISH